MRLETYRKKNGLTYKALAESLGMDMGMVYRYCNGDRIPTLQVAYAIVRRTRGDVTYKDLLKAKVTNLNDLMSPGCRRSGVAAVDSGGDGNEDEEGEEPVKVVCNA